MRNPDIYDDPDFEEEDDFFLEDDDHHEQANNGQNTAETPSDYENNMGDDTYEDDFSYEYDEADQPKKKSSFVTFIIIGVGIVIALGFVALQFGGGVQVAEVSQKEETISRPGQSVQSEVAGLKQTETALTPAQEIARQLEVEDSIKASTSESLETMDPLLPMPDFENKNTQKNKEDEKTFSDVLSNFDMINDVEEMAPFTSASDSDSNANSQPDQNTISKGNQLNPIIKNETSGIENNNVNVSTSVTSIETENIVPLMDSLELIDDKLTKLETRLNSIENRIDVPHKNQNQALEGIEQELRRLEEKNEDLKSEIANKNKSLQIKNPVNTAEVEKIISKKPNIVTRQSERLLRSSQDLNKKMDQPWVIRSVTPNKAILYNNKNGELKTVRIGDQVEYLGRITSISGSGFSWKISGTKNSLLIR